MLDAKPEAQSADAAFVSEESAPAAVVPKKNDRLEIDRYFEALVKLDGSDLHLKVDQPPIMRVKGSLQRLKAPPIGHEQMKSLCLPMLDDRQMKILEDEGGADFAYSSLIGDTRWRFRVNLLYQQGSLGMVARKVNNTIPNFEKLFLPASIERLCTLDQGMVLLAGVTGSGKSTTIGSMLNYINRNYRKHILTLEDPVEFVHKSQGCIINHREVGIHTQSFSSALRGALREDPDVILVGEMRDLETISLALEAASTGHLVFGTLHTQSAGKTIDRVIDVFPANQQAQIRTTLSEALKGVIAQNLFKRVDKKGRMAVLEILVVTAAVSNLIREGKTFQIPSVIQTGKKYGMQSLDDSILKALEEKKISAEDAFDKAIVKDRFVPFLKTPPEFY